MTRFVAIDVETANADMASICQIGGVVFENGREVDCFSTLIDPEDWFDDYNTRVHGIGENDVRDAPVFADYHEELCRRTAGQIVVCHTHFDRVSLSQACDLDELDDLTCTWLDSAKLARRVWAEVSCGGYGLANLAAMLGIQFTHHDALHDARTAGLILLAAMDEAKIDLNGCVQRCERRIPRAFRNAESGGDRPKLAGGEGPLSDHRIVFTGSLTIPRPQAAALANGFGAAIDANVTKKTTILVVGDTDIKLLRGQEKSNKHRKAEDLMAKGQPIRIVRESDFAQLCNRDHLWQ